MKLKINDILRFENYVSISYMIITDIKNGIVCTKNIEFNKDKIIVNIYDNDINLDEWDSDNKLVSRYKLFKNYKEIIYVLFTYKIGDDF